MLCAGDSIVLDTDKSLLTKSWTAHQKKLIILVKNNPVIYLQPAKPSIKWDTAWKEIASILCEPSNKCKQLWTRIKFGYAKTLILINTGKISKEMAMSHPETARFFDGHLSFMDPHISQITDEDIPYLIHKSMNGIFGLETKPGRVLYEQNNTQFVTHSQVLALLVQRKLKEGSDDDSIDMGYLKSVVHNAVEKTFEELLPTNNYLSNPRNELVNKDDDNLNKDEENTTKRIKLGLESELIIEDDVKMEHEDYTKIEDEGDNNKNLTLDKNVFTIRDGNDYLEIELPRIQTRNIPDVDDSTNTLSDMKNDDKVSEGNMDDLVDKNGPPISDDYIRTFCKELGDVMSLELSVFKQKKLQSRLNELIIRTLVKEKDQNVVISSEVASRAEDYFI